MANYFVKEGNVLQMRPVVPVGFRRVVRAEKAEGPAGQEVMVPPVTRPIMGNPASRPRSLRPLFLIVIFGWAFFIALGAVIRWAVS